MHNSSHFLSENNTSLFCQSWLPQRTKSVVILVHGFGDHSSRYSQTAEELNRNDFSVWAYDQEGHGRSGGTKGYVNHFDDLVCDLRTFINMVLEDNPNTPLFLLGHSLGGLVSAFVALEMPDVLQGLVLTSPALKVDSLASPVLIAASRILSNVAPKLKIVPAIVTRHLSKDPEAVLAYENDPLCFHGPGYVRTGYEILLATRNMEARAAELVCPLLVVQGVSDQIIPPETIRAVYDKFGSDDKTLHTMPGLYHEVMFEPEKAETLAIIVNWLNKRSAVSG